MQIVVVGAQEVSAKLTALPGRLVAGTVDATDRLAHLEVEAVRADTPRLTGSLAASERAVVTATVDGAHGQVLSDLRYASFVDRGTRQHGPARRMFERGSEQAGGEADPVYEAAMDAVAREFG